jgi:hypothetical protein
MNTVIERIRISPDIDDALIAALCEGRLQAGFKLVTCYEDFHGSGVDLVLIFQRIEK